MANYLISPTYSGTSQEDIKRRRKLADALMYEPIDTSPVQHWTQGLARLMEGFNRGMMRRRLEKDEAAAAGVNKSFWGELGGGEGGGASSSDAPFTTGAPGAGQSTGRVHDVPDLDKNEIASGFMNAVRAGDDKVPGLTNPYGLAAVAATGSHESRFSPGNVYRQWSDPSESGQAGDAGGIMSWRAERLSNMRNFAARNGGDADRPSPELQGRFFLHEDPNLIAALEGAKSTDEAIRLMNGAWRFAGYDRAGGEAGRRAQTARSLLGRYESGGGQPVQVASLDPSAGMESLPSRPKLVDALLGSDKKTIALPYATPENEPGKLLSGASGIQMSRAIPTEGAPAAEDTLTADPVGMSGAWMTSPALSDDPETTKRRKVAAALIDRTPTASVSGASQPAAPRNAKLLSALRAGPQYQEGGDGRTMLGMNAGQMMGQPGTPASNERSPGFIRRLANLLNGSDETDSTQTASVATGGRAQVADASGGTGSVSTARLYQIVSDPMADDSVKSYATYLLRSRMDQEDAARQRAFELEDEQRKIDQERADPAYQLGLEKTRRELDALDNPAPAYEYRESGGDTFRFNKNDPNARPELFIDGPDPSAAPTNDQRDYLFYSNQEREAGRQPLSFQEWGVASKKAGAQSINVDAGADAGKFGEKLGQLEAQRFNDISVAGDAARTRLPQIDQLDALLNNSGSGGMAAIRQWAGEYGFKTEGSSDIEAAQALINQMVPTQRQPGSGTMSDADLALFKSSLPRILNTPGGNSLIVGSMRGIAQYETARGDIADLLADGAITQAEARKRLRELPNPLADFTKQIRGRAGGTGSPPAAGPEPSSAAPSAGPAIGDIVDGFRFKGGDPSNQSNWEPAR